MKSVTSLFLIPLVASLQFSCSSYPALAIDVANVNCGPLGGVNGFLVERDDKALMMTRDTPFLSPVPLRGCAARNKTYQFEPIVRVMRETNGYRYCRYTFQNMSQTLRPFELFQQWSSYTLEQREQTKDKINAELMQYTCPYTSVREGKAEWYFENIGTSNEPMMISNVRTSNLKYYWNNKGLAFDKRTASNFYIIIREFLIKQQSQ